MSNFEKVAQQFKQNVEEWYRNVVAPASDGGEQISRAEFKALGDGIKDAMPRQDMEMYGLRLPNSAWNEDYYSTLTHQKLTRESIIGAIFSYARSMSPELKFTVDDVRRMDICLDLNRSYNGLVLENRYILSDHSGREIHVIHHNEHQRSLGETILQVEAYENGKFRRLYEPLNDPSIDLEMLYAEIMNKVRDLNSRLFRTGETVFFIEDSMYLDTAIVYGGDNDPSYVDELWKPNEKPQILTMAEYGVKHFDRLLRYYAKESCPEYAEDAVPDWMTAEIKNELSVAARAKGLTAADLDKLIADAVDHIASKRFADERANLRNHSSVDQVDRSLRYLEKLSALMVPDVERPEELKMPDRHLLLLEVYLKGIVRLRATMSPHPHELLDTARSLVHMAQEIGLSPEEVYHQVIDKYFEALYSKLAEHPGPSSVSDPRFARLGRTGIQILDLFLGLSQDAFKNRGISLHDAGSSHHLSLVMQLCAERIRAYQGQADPLVQDYIQVHLKYLKWLAPTHPLFDELPQ